jgi:type III restriction enzyme
MKLKFNPNLDFQLEAINSIVDIFNGQETCRTNFTVVPLPTDQLQYTDLGVGNRIQLLDEEILKNVEDIQLRNGLKSSEDLGSMDFTVEMETGTGKTYVYLRTIFELNKKYGFTKFIIVVPSIAIKEGVYKSLEITQEHIKQLYDNVQYDYFIYDSSKLEQVRSFALNDYIQIMVINIDAFRKSFTDPEKETRANIIHRTHDRLSGLKPIDFIQETNPIVIIDEPQSVDNTEKAREAIKSLNPLCRLRYSATHREKYNLMYKLDSVDAYERQLVKQIEVASFQVRGGHNQAYIRLLSVSNDPFRARIEIDVLNNGKVRRVERVVKSGDDLFELSGGRDVYEGYIIKEIYCGKGNEYIDFTSNPDVVRLSECIGDVNQDEFKKIQITRTIEEHLDKELRLRERGIKVLSLFFIDRVANYREYDGGGNPQKGKYARIFEEEYRKILAKPKYNTLFEDVDLDSEAEIVHNGYFAIDRIKDAKGESRFKETRGDTGNTIADESAYQLIMKDKEKLLSFESKLKFIFSHSALKEGWDNPNVFQICTLNETGSEMKKRQEIGRGLRIAVNQDGERIHGFNVNTLTVMANESYEDFVNGLQKEIEKEEGIRFGVIEKHSFANIVQADENEKRSYLGFEASERIWEHLLKKEYIDKNGKAQDKLKKDIIENKVLLPEEFGYAEPEILRSLKKITSKLNIKDADERKKVEINKQVFLSPDFKELWEKIKYRTFYRVNFDTEKLIDECARQINDNLIVGKTKIDYEKYKANIDRGGITGDKVSEAVYVYNENSQNLPDIISFLQNETNLKRKTLVEILIKSKKLKEFKNNPQKFIEETAGIIKKTMRNFIVDGIKYQKLGDGYYWEQDLFVNEDLHGYLYKNMIEADKSVYDYVIYDSDIERKFVEDFERQESVKLYAKLPKWFCINTPLGKYNPDWAVLIDNDGKEKLYFVVESKGSLFPEELRPAEQSKIKCGKEHFAALNSDVNFAVSNDLKTLIDRIE